MFIEMNWLLFNCLINIVLIINFWDKVENYIVIIRVEILVKYISIMLKINNVLNRLN